jgi:hypothetical protein
MSINSFKCSRKFSLSEYCNYCRNNIRTMVCAHKITLGALYRCYSSFTRNCDTLYSRLLIPFLIEFNFFVTIKTHTHTHTYIEALCSVQDKAPLYQPEGRGFGALCNEYMFNLHNPSFRTRPWGVLNL